MKADQTIVYTCQRPEPPRCGFFLWATEAKTREARTVLSNSHTESSIATEVATPARASSSKKSVQSTSPLTPYSKSKHTAKASGQLTERISSHKDASKRDDEWLYVSDNDFDDPQIRDLIDHEVIPPPETPSKSIKRNAASSPGKRSHEEFQERSKGRPTYGKPTNEIELFNTPNETRGRGLFSGGQSIPQTRSTAKRGGLVSPGITPATDRFGPPINNQYYSSEKMSVARDESPTARKGNSVPYPDLSNPLVAPERSPEKRSQMTPLASQILGALHSENTVMTDKILSSVKTISFAHVTEFDTIQKELNQVKKTRDWCREKIKKQEVKIADLEAEIAKLKNAPSGRR